MPTIELDIIKQRSDKLLPSEKRELIEYLTGSLADDRAELRQDQIGFDINDLADDDSKLVS